MKSLQDPGSQELEVDELYDEVRLGQTCASQLPSVSGQGEGNERGLDGANGSYSEWDHGHYN